MAFAPPQTSNQHRPARALGGSFSARLLLVIAVLLMIPDTFAFSTGTPSQFSVAPATVRQRAEATTSVVATVVLKTPSPGFFICQVRSSDPDKLTFSTIIFKKGDREGKSAGTVKWSNVDRDCRVKVSAFSVDAPDIQLSFTVELKIRQDE
jgi:hypothetical protein